MRELRKHSVKDNLNYLKEEYGELYSFFQELTKQCVEIYHVKQEEFDDERFEMMLDRMTYTFPQVLLSRFRNPSMISSLKEEGNLRPLANLFLDMFLKKIDRYHYASLDPEIKELYDKAQILIREQEDAKQEVCKE